MWEAPNPKQGLLGQVRGMSEVGVTVDGQVPICICDQREEFPLSQRNVPFPILYLIRTVLYLIRTVFI